MKYKSVLVLGPELGIACTVDGLTATELAQYAMGYYENLFQPFEPVYPEGKSEFLADVLCNGYTECERVTKWAGVAQVVQFDYENHLPTPKAKLDHATFGDRFATQLMMKKFANIP